MSKPSSMKSSCSLEIVDCQEYFQQRRDVIVKERAKQSVDWNCRPVDTVNQLISTAAACMSDVNSNVGLHTAAKPDCHNELCLEKFGTEASDQTVAGVKVDPLECGAVEQAVDAEALNIVSFGMETPFTVPVEACSDPANDNSISDNSISIVVNNDDTRSIWQSDGVLQNDAAVSPESTGDEKIGFEPEAITATEQWPSRSSVVERRVKRLQSEVRRLLYDDNGSGVKRELRASNRCLGGVRRKTRRSPLQRLRTVVGLRTSTSSRHPDKLSGKIASKRN